MTAYTITWTAHGTRRVEKRDTWSEAVGVQAAHQAHGATLAVVDPTVTACAHCQTVITQTAIPWRWDGPDGDDLCTVMGRLRHEPAPAWA